MIAQVILLDLALGADNSAVIGMAAKNLNHKLRKKAILIGTAGAVIARFVLAVVATYLMQIPFLKTVGAVILLWIGMGLIAGEDDGEKEIKSSQTLGGAIRTIILADVIMSLDNVLAIVGATDGHLGMLAFGMVISVPIIVFGSTLVLKLMDRFPVAIYVAAMVIVWAAGGMIATDASKSTSRGSASASESERMRNNKLSSTYCVDDRRRQIERPQFKRAIVRSVLLREKNAC